MKNANKSHYAKLAMYALLALATCVIAVKNYHLLANDLLSNDSDFSSHAIRPYFLLEGNGFAKEWYNGTPLFMYYPPVSILLDSAVYLFVGNLGLALSISMLILQAAFLAICMRMAALLGGKWTDGAFAASITLASTISVGRFFNAGRYGEFAGFVMLFLWLLAILQYYIRPTKRNLAFLFFASLVSSLAHFLETIMLLGFFGILLAAYLAFGGKQKTAMKNMLAISIAGFAPSIVFWAPFIEASNKPSIAGTALSGYVFLVGGLLTLAAACIFMMKYRSFGSIAIASILLFWGLGKVTYFPPQLGDDFSTLTMDGKYFALREVPAAAYSVLASRGFSSSWGNYDPAADNSLIEKFMQMESNCASIRDFAAYTDSKYVISGPTGLGACGFKEIYSKKLHVYRID